MFLKDNKVYVVIINWNGWKYTIECLESLKKQKYRNFQVIISDNASSDDSVEKIKEYLSGRSLIKGDGSDIFKQYVEPITSDEIEYFEFESSEVEKFDFSTQEYNANKDKALWYPVIFVKNPANYGTSRGNNVGFRFALTQDDASYIWVLNNDVALDFNALGNLVDDCERDPKIGATASVLRFYDDPGVIQTIGGGKFWPVIGTARLCSKNSQFEELGKKSKDEILSDINYLMSCSMLIKVQALKDCGIYDEDFFVYTEETEWSFRIQKLGWKISTALDSYIFHKESASTKGIRHMYFYLLNKSNQVFVRKHYGRIISLVAIFPMILNAARTAGCFQNFKAAIKGILKGTTQRIGPMVTTLIEKD